MRFFEKFFGELTISENTGEATVCCPFPHKQADGTEHIEKVPSAHINPTKGTFHCKVPSCLSKKYGAKGGLSEASFLSAMQGITYGEATRILASMEGYAKETENWDKWHRNLLENILNPKSKVGTLFDVAYLTDHEAIKEFKLGYKGRGIVFPVFIYNEYMGACDYNPVPGDGRKAILDKGMPQAIWPFDIWREDKRDTYLCAGFKDAMAARIRGLNAITFTHGEGSFPRLYKRMFKDRKVYICYDNDEGGREGARKTAALLKEVGAIPVIVDLSPVCVRDKEDISDFFNTYDKDVNDLVQMAISSPLFTEEEYEKEREKVYPLVTLQQALSGKVVGQILSSRVAVVADYSEAYRVPDVVEVSYSEDSMLMEEGEVRVFSLEEDNIEDVLQLADSKLRESEIMNNIKQLVGLPSKENCHIKTLSYTVVHKAVVTDDSESEILHEVNENYAPTELTVYSIGEDSKLVNGNKYRIFYKSVAHPYKAQEIHGVVTNIEDSDTSVNAFKVNEDVIKSLKCFQVDEEKNVKAKMEELYQRSKAFLGPEANKPVFLATELFYHTPLKFTIEGEIKTRRAYLEAMIVGESRTHKSATAKGLMGMYELGAFISLKNSTTPGLVGGSNGSPTGGYKTRLGVIPRNHKGAVILEEFSGAPADFIKAMTDVRSSNVVRIQRAIGTLTAPAMVRMLTLSNAKPGYDGTTTPLNQYPSGAKVLLELVGTAEDINRYDFFILKDEGKTIDPNTPIEHEAYDKDSYKNRIRWVWSRKPEQVQISSPIRDYIVTTAKDLNRKYETHIQFFGREAWIKLTRIAIAVAGCVCSMDETGEKIVVNEEHVLWAKNFMVACYDNEIFNMKAYVEEERSYTKCDRNDIQLLQGIFNKNATLIENLEKGTVFPPNQLRVVSGENDDDYKKLIHRLATGKFIKWTNQGLIQPSAKFRTAVRLLDRQSTSLRRV